MNILHFPGVGLLFIIMFIASLIRPEETKEMMSSLLFVWIMSGIFGALAMMITLFLTVNFWPTGVVVPVLYVALGVFGKRICKQ